MKHFTMNMMIAAATLTVAAGVAGAQTIKAEVPFGFSAAGTMLPAGLYRVEKVQRASGSEIFTLTNEDTHRSILTMPYAHNSQKPGEARVALTFECAGTDCVLVQVAPGSGQSYQIWKPKAGREGTRLAVIRAVMVNGR